MKILQNKIYKYLAHFTYNTRQYIGLKNPFGKREIPKYFKNKVKSYNINRDINDKNEIPKNLFLCYKNKEIPETILNNFKKLNKNWNIQFYDDDECRNFINEHYNDLSELFNKIKDGPIRADLFRLCILNKYGGFYTDIDNIINSPLDDFIDNTASFVIASGVDKGYLNPAFMGSTQNNPILENTINLYRNIISKEKYSYWTYSIVYALTYILKDHISIIKNQSKIIKINNSNQKIQILNEKNFMKFKDLFKCYKNLNLKYDNFMYICYNSKKIINTHSTLYDTHKHKFI